MKQPAIIVGFLAGFIIGAGAMRFSEPAPGASVRPVVKVAVTDDCWESLGLFVVDQCQEPHWHVKDPTP